MKNLQKRRDPKRAFFIIPERISDASVFYVPNHPMPGTLGMVSADQFEKSVMV